MSQCFQALYKKLFHVKLITISDEAEISETCWNKYLNKTIRCIVFFVHKIYLQLSLYTGVPAKIPPPPIPGYCLDYRSGDYPRLYSRSSQSILHMPRLYPIKFKVGYGLGERGILWEISYITYNQLSI